MHKATKSLIGIIIGAGIIYFGITFIPKYDLTYVRIIFGGIGLIGIIIMVYSMTRMWVNMW